MANSNTVERRAFIFLLAVLLAAGAWVLFPFLKTLLIGAVFTVLLYPVHKKYLAWTKGRGWLAASLSVLTEFITIVIPLVIIFVLLTAQLTSIVNAPSSETDSTSMSEVLSFFKVKLIELSRRFESLSGLDVNLDVYIRGKMKELAGVVAAYMPSILSETMNFGLHLFVMLTVSYYLFLEGEGFLKLWIRLSPVKDQYEKKLVEEIRETIQGVFYGSFLTAIVQAILATIGYYLAGLDGFLVWGLITFFMAFLPILGTGIVVIPLVLVLLLQGDTGPAVFLLLYGMAVVGTSDNLLRPLLIRSNMHPLVLFLSIFGGLAVFGMIGLLFGPIILAVLSATLKIYAKDFA